MNILITLDYELYLGRETGTPDNCLIRPMDKLSEILSAHQAKFVVFVDAAYLLRLHQLQKDYAQLKTDFEKVSTHIQLLEKEGHDIQLHFHPQWLYSNWEEGENRWKMDYQHYKLSDMDPTFARHSFSEAKNLLDSLLATPTRVFRAGGYCLDDFAGFTVLFEDNGIIADSSVSRGNFRISGSHHFDYRRVPKSNIYRFSSSIKEEDSNGRFTEYSISNFKLPYLISKVSLRSLKKKYDPLTYHYGDGVSIGNSVFKDNITKKGIIKRLFSMVNFTASLDRNSSSLLEKHYAHCKKNCQDMVVVGHPKEATVSSIDNLSHWLSKIEKTDRIVTTKDLLG